MRGGDVGVRTRIALHQSANHVHQEDDGDEDLQDDGVVLEGDEVVHDAGDGGPAEVAEGKRGGEQPRDHRLHLRSASDSNLKILRIIKY